MKREDPMEIRAVRESELEEMVKLQCLIFPPDRYESSIPSIEQYWHYIRGDPSYRLEQTRVVIVDGRIVARLRIWDRDMRIGSCSVRMGGIGGVGTHPDHRRAGYASAMMREAIEYMHSAGYGISVLFSRRAQPLYRSLGYECVPMEGVRIVPRRAVDPVKTDWQVEPFDEERDLEEVVRRYDLYNAKQSGSIVRSRAHWDTTTARLRGTLPALVVHQGDTLGGYLSWVVEGNAMHVHEVAYDRLDPSTLVALAHHLLWTCEEKQIKEIRGKIPYLHPLIDQLVEGCDGDLYLTGNSEMMLYAVNLQQFLGKLLPEWQSRLDAAHQEFAAILIGIELNDQHCVLHLDHSGTLHIQNADPVAHRLNLPGEFFWRACIGESSWSQIEPALHARGVRLLPEISTLLSVLFPQQEVVFWAPDYF